MTTPTREALLALVIRCETEEPSRELDRAIAKGLGYEVQIIEIPEGHPMADIFKVGSGLEFMYRPGCDREAIPPYTSSLDAAVMLVPDGWFWRVGYTPIFNGWAHVSRTHADHCDRNDEHSSTTAPNPTLALCAAALRARAALQGESDHG